MDSVTKTKLTPEQINALAEAVFGKEISIIQSSELSDGWFNTAYELELSDHRFVVLKIAPSSDRGVLTYERNIMRTEVEALRLIRTAGSVPVPEVYSFDPSRTIIDSEYFFMEKVAGTPYNQLKDSLSKEEQAVIEKEIGQFNYLINEVRGEHFGYFLKTPLASSSSWPDTFSRMISELLEDGKRLGVQLPASYEEVAAEVELHLPILGKVKEPRLVHWDLWNGNVFVKDGHVSAIIDFERALWGDPLQEYYFRPVGQSDAFLQGYGNRFEAPDELERRKLYDFYFELILVIECHYRQYEDQNHLKWAYSNLVQRWERIRSR